MLEILDIMPNAQALAYCLGFKLNAWFHLLPLTYIYGCYLIIKLTSMCDRCICTYKTYQHDAKYLFELYSMTLQTFSYVVPASGNLLSKGWVPHPSDEQCSER